MNRLQIQVVSWMPDDAPLKSRMKTRVGRQPTLFTEQIFRVLPQPLSPLPHVCPSPPSPHSIPTAFDAVPYFRPQAPFSCLVLVAVVFISFSWVSPFLFPFQHTLFSCPFSFGPKIPRQQSQFDRIYLATFPLTSIGHMTLRSTRVEAIPNYTRRRW